MIPGDIYKALVKAGIEWAEANFLWQQLDDQSKPMLAAITIEAKQVEGVTTMAEAGQIALSTATYRDHLRDTARAKRDALKAKVMYDSTKALFEAQRTVEATQRAAMGAAP